MRHAVIVLLAFVGGCSLLWPMSDYDAKPRASTGDGGASTSSDGGDGSSGGSSSGASGEAGSDAAVDPNDCPVDDPEPNETPGDAVEVPDGVTCGKIGTPGDLDYYEIDATTGSVKVTITLRAGVQLTVTGTTDPRIYQTPAVFDLFTSGAKRTLLFQSYNGSLGTYQMERE